MRKVDIGRTLQEFPGQTFNELIEHVEKLIRSGQAPTPIPQPSAINYNTIRTRNTTGAGLPFASVLALVTSGDSLLNTPSTATPNGSENRRPAINVRTPSTGDTKFVILQSPTPINGAAEGLRLGFTFVKVYFTSASHGSATIKDSDNTQLESASSGAAEIWWHEALPEELPATRWALVLLGGGGGGGSAGNGIFGKTAMGISARSGTTAGSGILDIYRLEGTAIVAADESATVYNITTVAIEGGDAYIQAKQLEGGQYIVDFEEC